MVILHIAHVDGNACNGVDVAVLQHVKAQQKLEKVGFINIAGRKFDGIDNQLDCSSPFSLLSLPQPFDRPDIVVFHEFYRPKYLRMYKTLKKSGVPYIIVPHGEMTVLAQRSKRLKKTVANILLFNAFVRGSLALQCLSTAEVERTKFRKEKFVATNGVWLPERIKSEFSERGVKFVFIGRLDIFFKGLDLMIEAVSSIADFMRDNGCNISIYGPDFGGRFAAVSKMIEDASVGDIVSLNREVLGKDKEEKLLENDCFIQTSRSEGMPMGILEAMSYGLPLLVTEGTTLSGVVDEYGAGQSCHTDVQSIADALKRVACERDSWESKSRGARRIAEELFSWDKVAQTAIDEYKRRINLID